MLIAIFNNEKNKAIVSGAWQYDYGQKLYIHGLELPEVVEIGFSLTETGGMDYPRFAITKDGVTKVAIPDEMMEGNDVESDYRIYAFVFVEDEKQESGQTIKSIEIRVKARPKRWMDDTTGDNFSEIVKAVRELVEEYKKSGVSDEQVRAALKDYLTDHPIDTMTEDEVRAIVNAMLGDVTQTHFEKVDVLPNEGEENIIYLVPAENTEEQNIYDEYIFLNGIPELIGTTKIDLKGYTTKEEFRQLSQTMDDLKENGTGGAMTTNAKALLGTLLRATVYDKDVLADPKTVIDALIEELGKSETPDTPVEPEEPDVPVDPDEPTPETYTVTYNLTSVTSSNKSTTVTEGGSYTTVLSSDSVIDKVVVKMGGVDITETAYNSVSKTITIAEITGDIVITASIADSSLLYTLKDASFDGKTIIDTGVALFDEPKDFTILLDVEDVLNDGSTVGFAGIYDSTNTFDSNRAFYCAVLLENKNDAENEKVYVRASARYTELNSTKTIVSTAGTSTDTTSATRKWSGKVAVTHNSTTNTWAGYSVNADTGERVDNSVVAIFDNIENTISIGGVSYRGKTSFKCNEFSIYNRILSADEISAWLQ